LEKDYETAISELNFLISQFPNSEHTEEAEFLIVQSYAVKVKTIEHDEEDIKIALEKLKRFLDKYPDSHYKEEARYLQKRLENLLAHKIFKIAELYEKLKRFSSAEIYYRDVMEKYPGTIWAEKAENRLKEIRQKK
jgi:outer membrane protein assembly factor BamD